MGFGFRQTLGTSLQQRVDPRVVLSSQLLEMNQVALESRIEVELNENPALERIDSDEEPLTRETILQSLAPYELAPGGENRELQRSMPPGSMDDIDWLDFAASTDSLAAHLRGQLFASLPVHLHEIAEFVVDSVNDRGYLETTPEDAALACNTSLEDAEIVIRELKQCEPAGIGATNLQECLVLQLRGATSVEEKLAKAIVKDRFEDLVQKNTRALARAFQVHPEVVQAAFAVISSLNPYPGEGFLSGAYGHASSDSRAVTADLVFSRTESGWLVEVKGADPTQFMVNRIYAAKLESFEKKLSGDRDEKRHIQDHVERAKRFIDSLEHRNRTICRIGEYLANEQAGFINTGDVKFIRPLTRSRLAEELGLHESAVSRATSDKFVQLANGDVVSFDLFFNPALRAQQVIREILETENPNKPLSDERIAKMLAERGIHIARRTVNKYRDRSRMLSSRRRKSA